MIRPILTYAGPVWSNTSQSNYRHLQILQSKCLRVIGDYPRRSPITYLHSTLSLELIHTFIYRLTEKFFQNCTTHSNPLISQIGNYSLPDLLAQNTKYIHKRTKHLLLQILPDNRSVFLHCTYFSLLYPLCTLLHSHGKSSGNTVVNWLSEQFIQPTCTGKNFEAIKKKKKVNIDTAHSKRVLVELSILNFIC
jgi:hypothetical protein